MGRTSTEFTRLTQFMALRIDCYLERQGLLERDAEIGYMAAMFSRAVHWNSSWVRCSGRAQPDTELCAFFKFDRHHVTQRRIKEPLKIAYFRESGVAALSAMLIYTT